MTRPTEDEDYDSIVLPLDEDSDEPARDIRAVLVRDDGERFTLDQPISDGSYSLEFEVVEHA